MVSIVNWFDAHRAKAVAVSQIGFSAGGLYVPFVMMGLEAGWRSMALYSSILILAVRLPMVSLVRHRPGVRKYQTGCSHRKLTMAPQETRVSLSWREAMKASFWLISSGHTVPANGIVYASAPHSLSDL